MAEDLVCWSAWTALPTGDPPAEAPPGPRPASLGHWPERRDPSLGPPSRSAKPTATSPPAPRGPSTTRRDGAAPRPRLALQPAPCCSLGPTGGLLSIHGPQPTGPEVPGATRPVLRTGPHCVLPPGPPESLRPGRRSPCLQATLGCSPQTPPPPQGQNSVSAGPSSACVACDAWCPGVNSWHSLADKGAQATPPAAPEQEQGKGSGHPAA